MRVRMIKAQIRSFFKNLAKRKFYSIFRSLWDAQYRADIYHMLTLTCASDMVLGHGRVSLGSIVAGHSINYPEWVDFLTAQIHYKGWKSLEPIKVIYDPTQRKWLVVDGNHRFEALKRSLPDHQSIPVFILRPVVENQPIDVEVRDVTRDQANQLVLGVPYKRSDRG